ncbi:MAG: futalosine hydrolase [Paraglaciecola sp.]|jgi:futalosine hydrolase
MRLLIVSATPFETAPIRQFLETHGGSEGENLYKYENLEVKILVTGVGMPYTAYSLGKFLALNKVDLVINAGVAGAFSKDLKIGDVVNVIAERFGDLGAEDADGSFMDIHEMDLIPPNEEPFLHGQMNHPLSAEITFLPKVKGLTVNKVHGSVKSIEAVKKKYEVDIESMEGAAFFMVCLLEEVNFLEIRAISNYVEPRNRDAWDLPLSITNLNKTLLHILTNLIEKE